jgi:hypothetical protein
MTEPDPQLPSHASIHCNAANGCGVSHCVRRSLRVAALQRWRVSVTRRDMGFADLEQSPDFCVPFCYRNNVLDIKNSLY